MSNLIELLAHASKQELFADSIFIKTSDNLGRPLFQVSHGIYSIEPEVTFMMSFDIFTEVQTNDGETTYEELKERQYAGLTVLTLRDSSERSILCSRGRTYRQTNCR